MSITEHGVSTTRTPGEFACEQFHSRIRRKPFYQWDYRDSSGELHSGIAMSRAAAITAAELASGEVIR